MHGVKSVVAIVHRVSGRVKRKKRRKVGTILAFWVMQGQSLHEIEGRRHRYFIWVRMASVMSEGRFNFSMRIFEKSLVSALS